MPWDVQQGGGGCSGYAVMVKATGKMAPGGCHPDMQAAMAHMRALYANALAARISDLESAVVSIGLAEFGDVPGHEFHGNQYTAAKELRKAGFEVDKVTADGKIFLHEHDNPVEHFEKTVDAAKVLQDKGYRTRIAPHGQHHHIEVFAVQEFGDVPGHKFHGNQYTYEVDYSVDHEAMQRGEYKTSKVKVQANNEVEANLLAAQMVGHRGIPTATRHISTRMEIQTASHGNLGDVREGDVVVDASKLGRPGRNDFKNLEGATLHKSEEAMGAAALHYTDKNGYEKTDYIKGGRITVDRPAIPPAPSEIVRGRKGPSLGTLMKESGDG